MCTYLVVCMWCDATPSLAVGTDDFDWNLSREGLQTAIRFLYVRNTQERHFSTKLNCMDRNLAGSQNCEKRLLTFSCVCLSVSPSVRMRTKIGFYWTNCYEVWHLRIFPEIFWENSSLLKCETNDRLTADGWRLLYMKTDIHLGYMAESFIRIRNVGKGATLYGARALYAGYLRLQTHTPNTQYVLLLHCKIGSMNVL
jgi:hypothetical protein